MENGQYIITLPCLNPPGNSNISYLCQLPPPSPPPSPLAGLTSNISLATSPPPYLRISIASSSTSSHPCRLYSGNPIGVASMNVFAWASSAARRPCWISIVPSPRRWCVGAVARSWRTSWGGGGVRGCFGERGSGGKRGGGDGMGGGGVCKNDV